MVLLASSFYRGVLQLSLEPVFNKPLLLGPGCLVLQGIVPHRLNGGGKRVYWV